MRIKPSTHSACEIKDKLAKEEGWNKLGKLWVKPNPDYTRSQSNANRRTT